MIDALTPIAGWWLSWMVAATWQVALLAALVGVALWALPEHLARRARHPLWMLIALRLLIPPIIPLPADGPLASFEPVVAMSTSGLGGGATQIAVAMLLWAAGVIVVTGVTLSRLFRLRRFARSSSTAAPEEIRSLADGVAVGLGLRRTPEIRVSDTGAGPMLIGYRNPCVILPSVAADGWSTAILSHVLMHELTHVRRRDLLYESLFAVVNALYWFHPLVYLARRRAHDAREICCDASVAAQAGTPYRDTLLRLAANRHLGQAMAGSAAMGGGPAIIARLRALENGGAPVSGRARVLPSAIVAALAVFALAVTTPCGVERGARHKRDAAEIAIKALANEPGYGSLHARYATALYMSLRSESGDPAGRTE